jgi:hypothetical protein
MLENQWDIPVVPLISLKSYNKSGERRKRSEESSKRSRTKRPQWIEEVCQYTSRTLKLFSSKKAKQRRKKKKMLQNEKSDISSNKLSRSTSTRVNLCDLDTAMHSYENRIMISS